MTSPIHYQQSKQAAIDAACFVSDLIKQKLPRGKVILFVSGGSVAHNVVVELMKLWESASLDGLTVALADERYGLYDHKDSNALLLKKNGFLGFLSQKSVPFLAPLVAENVPMHEAVSRYETLIDEQLANTFSVALLGIGTDGHIAGIKPLEDEKQFEDLFSQKNIVVGYKNTDFERITMTNTGLLALGYAVVYAFGREKHGIIKNLTDEYFSAKINSMPAIILRSMKSVSIFYQ